MVTTTIMMSVQLLAVLCVLCALVPCAHTHARMFNPPGRASMWRYGYSTPINYNDHQLWCGGFWRLALNGGKCGICGDAWDAPRENEAGGKFATGQIVGSFRQGQTIPVEVDLAVNHRGFFQFRLCPNNDVHTAATPACLDRHLLHLEDGSTEYHVTTDRSGSYHLQLQLPSDVTCSQCVLQMRYHTGISWGCDEKNTGCCIGCGLQEEFYACADIAIQSTGNATSGSMPGGFQPVGVGAGQTSVVGGSQPLTTPSGVSTQQGSSGLPGTQVSAQDCHATAIWAGTQADAWCRINCAKNNCPSLFCTPECLST